MYDIAAQIFDTDNFIKNDPVRYAIKNGNHYSVLFSTTVAAASTTYLLAITPNTTVRQHITMTAWSSAQITVNMYYNATAASTGVISKTAYNSNHRSTNVTTMSFMTAASSDLTSTGTLYESQICLANNFVKFGGNDFVTREYILAQNTKYIFSFVAAATTTIIGNLYYYED